MSDTRPGGKSPHDTEETTVQTSTTDDGSPDWEAVGRELAGNRLETAGFDLRETFVVKAHTDGLDAEDLRELFDELQEAAEVVGRIAEHTPGIENEARPYRNLTQEETAKAIGYVDDGDVSTGGNGE